VSTKGRQLHRTSTSRTHTSRLNYMYIYITHYSDMRRSRRILMPFWSEGAIGLYMRCFGGAHSSCCADYFQNWVLELRRGPSSFDTVRCRKRTHVSNTSKSKANPVLEQCRKRTLCLNTLKFARNRLSLGSGISLEMVRAKGPALSRCGPSG
jgi:hypothetical protein